MKLDICFIDSEREIAEYLLRQLSQAAAPMRFKTKHTARDGREHMYLSLPENCPVKPFHLTGE